MNRFGPTKKKFSHGQQRFHVGIQADWSVKYIYLSGSVAENNTCYYAESG